MELNLFVSRLLVLLDKVMFDNSYSYLTTKKIRYSVYITEPIEDVEDEEL